MLIFETLLTEIIFFNKFTAKRVAMYVPNSYVIFPLNYSCIKMRNNSKSHRAPKKVHSHDCTAQVLEAH